MTAPRWFLAVFMALLGAAPLAAQVLDPDRCLTCADSWQHFAAGAALDVVVRGPYITDSWRDTPIKRIAWVATIGAAYEGLQYFEARANGTLGQPGYGFSLKDLGFDVLGAVAVELMDAIIP